MLDITYGDTKNSGVVSTIVDALENADLTGDLYIGYPILGTIDGRIEVDALLVTQEHGLVALDLQSVRSRSFNDAHAEQLIERQDDIFVSLENKLKAYGDLRNGRRLAFDINVISVLPETEGSTEYEGRYISTADTILATLAKFDSIEIETHRALNAALQHTATIKPKKKRNQVAHPDSKGSTMRVIEASIANMDAWQKKAAIEFPEGPQRIRGLAGSGKTIVLAQKAAILHAKFPDWDIAVTFQTRSLYQQFQSLIERFYRELTLDDPDWEKLSILHAWGSASSSGIYYEVSRSIGHAVKDFGYAKSRYGYERAFEGICAELLKDLRIADQSKKYDAILIDEAQDFPQPFFEIVYHATNKPHRIIWAYDELQNLGDYTMSPATELFGNNGNGAPRVSLSNDQDSPQQDIVLPICYRNTKWALTMAHSLGFGIYREKGLVQFFDAPELWDDIGYRFLKGTPRGGNKVTVERKPNSSPAYFDERLTAGEAVSIHAFDSASRQYDWIAEQIEKNLLEDELDADDIMVVSCSPLTIRADTTALARSLNKRKIMSHVPGITSSRDVVFRPNSVALTGIYRAKGNEAPMVYIANSEYCFEGFELSKRRNILFTAMTRSRAWLRIAGVGPHMNSLSAEASQVVNEDYRLKFTYPSKEQIAKIKKLHRDRPEAEKHAIESDLEGLVRILRRIEEGDLDPDHLPKKIRQAIKHISPNS